MSLAQTYSAIQKKWIVRLSWRLRDSQRSRVREVVIVSNDKGFESVLRIKTQLQVIGDAVRGQVGGFALLLDWWLSRGRRGCSSLDDLELDWKLSSGSQCNDVLEQTHVVIFQPDFAKIISYFEQQAIIVLANGPQWGEPKIVRIGAQHRAEVLLCGCPNFVG